MLVLSRKAGERLAIGPEIVVTVVEIRGDCVKLGCEAPPELLIRRIDVGARPSEAAAEPQSPRKPESPFFVECA